MPISNRLVVLLADDDENDVILIRRSFKRVSAYASARLIVVEDGMQAISYLQGEGDYSMRSSWPIPDVVLLDQKMPKKSGLEVVSWIRGTEMYQKLPIILLSGGLAPAEVDQACTLQAIVCPKGLNTKEWSEVLSGSLQRAMPNTAESTPGKKMEVYLSHSLFADSEPIRIWT